MTPEKMQSIVEAALMVAGEPLTIAKIQRLFREEVDVTSADVLALLNAIRNRYQDTGIELKEVASGFRLQTKPALSPWLSKLYEEKPQRASRAFLETLAIIAYKQPVTRAEIENIRGVSISSNIVRALLDREWIRLIGYRELPGRPALYGTTKTFLDYFNLKSLSDLPPLAAFKNLEEAEDVHQVQLTLEDDSNESPFQETEESSTEHQCAG